MVSLHSRKVVALGLGSILALLGFASAIQEKRPKRNGMEAHLYDGITEDDLEADMSRMVEVPHTPTFAELGVSYTPKVVEGPEGQNVISFLHTSPTSSQEAHDSVSAPTDVPKHDIVGQVAGLVKGDPVTVILGTAYGSRFDILFEQKVSMEAPQFKFQLPPGKYYIKVEGSGYRLPGVEKIRLPCPRSLCRFSNRQDKITVRRIRKDPGIYKYKWVLQKAAQYGVESLSQVELTDASVINEGKAEAEQYLDSSDAATKLKMNFGIELHGAWGPEYSNRLLGMLEKWKWLKNFRVKNPSKQKWILTEESLFPQDVMIVRATQDQTQLQENLQKARKRSLIQMSQNSSTQMNQREKTEVYTNQTATIPDQTQTRIPRDQSRNQLRQQTGSSLIQLESTNPKQNEAAKKHTGNLPPETKDDDKYDQVVTISRQAFTYAVKHTFENKKQRGVYFSRRLHKALIRALCLHHPWMIRTHFLKMHDVLIVEPYELEQHRMQGRAITSFAYTDYQSWFLHPEELVEIATSWAEYPEGFQKINGLKYLLRRTDGTVNPQNPDAAAIAYPRGADSPSYIEFMEKAFKSYSEVPELILHELGHFIDFNMTTPAIRQKWVEVGGWFVDKNDPDGWSTRKQTEFVSAYAHKKNPSEDFASSIATYVLNPKLLMSRAPEKYTFMLENIMNGAYYVTKASHEFRVLNLGNADFMYPGRIVKIRVKVKGQVNEDKHIEFKIKLANNGEDSCAKSANFRLASSNDTFVTVNLYAAASRCGHILYGNFVMDKSQKRGVWTTDQIVVVDDKGLQRYVGAADFGMRVWIDNGGEDFQKPRVITPSIAVSLVKHIGKTFVRATFATIDDGSLRKNSGVYAAISSDAFKQYSIGFYTHQAYFYGNITPNWRRDEWQGHHQVSPQMCAASNFTRRQNAADLIFNTWKFDNEHEFAGLTADDVSSNLFKCYYSIINIPLNEYARTGNYFLSNVTAYDEGGNRQSLQWPRGKGPSVFYQSHIRYPDNTPPELRNVRVSSKPTNDKAPNGETLVTISLEVRDLQSGICSINGMIVDPFGGRYRHNVSFRDVKDWQQITYTELLPRGSVPGVWHLAEINLMDNAGNDYSAKLHEQVMVMQRR